MASILDQLYDFLPRNSTPTHHDYMPSFQMLSRTLPYPLRHRRGACWTGSSEQTFIRRTQRPYPHMLMLLPTDPSERARWIGPSRKLRSTR
jgi:hypothetical protein